MSDIRKRLVVALGGNAISAPGKAGHDRRAIRPGQRNGRGALRRDRARLSAHRHARQRPAGRQHPAARRACPQRALPDSARSVRGRYAGRHGLHDRPVPVERDEPAESHLRCDGHRHHGARRCRTTRRFSEPNKAIGPVLTAAQAEAHRTNDGWQVRDEGGGRFRRVVPSPLPRKIIEMPAIEHLVDAGQIVVCCGGGGIPVAVDSTGPRPRRRGRDRQGSHHRPPGPPSRSADARDPHRRRIRLHQLRQAERTATGADHGRRSGDASRTPANSAPARCGQRSKPAIDFVRHSPHADAVAIIAHVNHFADALDGKSGTRIVRSVT